MTARLMAMAKKRVASGGGGGFAPDDIGTLSAWFDASDGSSFTYHSGALVSQWSDLGPNGYHLTSPTSGNAPSRNRTVNSLDAVDFSSGKVVRRTSAPINNSSTGAWTVFAVAVPDVTSGDCSIVDADDQGGPGAQRIAQIIRISGTTPQTIGFVGGSAKADGGPTVTAGNTYVLRTLNDGSSIEMFVDGSGNGSTALGGSQNYLAGAPLTLGGSDDVATNTQNFDGAICEVICYSAALSSSDISDVETYLADKWGITL